MTSDIKKHLFGVDICAKDDNGSIPVDYSGIQLEIERILNSSVLSLGASVPNKCT